ncbi:MAG: methyltransferase domain-containing protein [Candidatus Eremiobacteraeota bacterium]|nr:methyltransferase domain-containing protein [Candidatus Eremiobacteraeota bacterium]
MSSEFGAHFWDERYRSRSAVWSGEPNGQLVREVSELAPGTALDAGCGEGADAIWLAERGWRVVAVDISAVALARARAVAIDADVARRIEWLRADLATWVPTGYYDLVSVQFMHVPKLPREDMFRRLAAAVEPNGSLLVVGHHPSDLETTMPRPPLPELFYTAAEVGALLEPQHWDIIVDAARSREAIDRAGQTVSIADAVLRARRRV